MCGVSRAAAVKPRASVPATLSGDPAVCTPSPHTVSAPRERSRSFRIPDTDRYFSYFVCFTRVSSLPLTTCTLATTCEARVAINKSERRNAVHHFAHAPQEPVLRDDCEENPKCGLTRRRPPSAPAHARPAARRGAVRSELTARVNASCNPDTFEGYVSADRGF
ncbi:hypothetical protein EVAR_26704_1 [Eumeta japonica]|uniref:Uncharacterized protein n=1 Tax=Eumeta variegata TaxID=151549 RepID=A0A4C1ZUD0_EUMVA|nr:hypothetical protein EVAR_26704_1 [Eumeta japonica]